MSSKRIGLILGAGALAASIFLPVPAGMDRAAFVVSGLTALMAIWWMSQAIPLTATALMPFVVLPLAGIMDAKAAASAYYETILFLILGGAFLALAIERTGLHKRLSLAILNNVGSGTPWQILLGFMASSAILSMTISNTSTALIMMPMALGVMAGGGIGKGETSGLAGALPMGIAFSASIGGLGTIIGSPTNGIAVGLLEKTIGLHITFVEWMAYGVPMVALAIPLAAFIIAKVQNISAHPFDVEKARAALGATGEFSPAEKRLLPLIALTFLLWITQPLVAGMLPKGSWSDGTIATLAALTLFIMPDGTGRPMLTWEEADRAPWAVIMMFGGGLALAEGMQQSGLALWLGKALLPLSSMPLVVVALAITAMVVLITEFASNVATASGIIPVVASLAAAIGVDPILLAMPAAIAASWGFMLPSGTGPNAIAWATGNIEMRQMVKAGFALDLIGIGLIVGVVFAVSAAF